MAELTAFGFLPGDSLVHRLDVRIKLLGLLGIGAVGLRSGFMGLLALGLFLGLLALLVHLPLKTLLRQLRLFGYLLLLVWISRALTTPGPPDLSWGPVQISRTGVLEGGLICSRLLLTLVAGLIFTAATRPQDIKVAVHWLLKWIPGFPAMRLAVMAGLVMRFFPLIFHNAREIRDAQSARCIQCRKNPFYRLIKTVVPLLRQTFQTADELALAMEARCYTSRRTAPRLTFSPGDWWALALLILLLPSFMILF